MILFFFAGIIYAVKIAIIIVIIYSINNACVCYDALIIAPLLSDCASSRKEGKTSVAARQLILGWFDYNPGMHLEVLRFA